MRNAQGVGAPTDIQPYMLERDGLHFNYSQLVPYISREMLNNQPLYERLSTVFADLFGWVKEHVSTLTVK